MGQLAQASATETFLLALWLRADFFREPDLWQLHYLHLANHHHGERPQLA
jgi:hypothetical protein